MLLGLLSLSNSGLANDRERTDELGNQNNITSTKQSNHIPLKNARLGKITYLNFATEPDDLLRQAFGQIENFEESRSFYQESGDFSYCYVKIDLNNDGFQDAFVTFNRSFASGSGGQHIWIFQGTKNGYKLVGEILHTYPPSILITTNKTQSWNDLIKIPGKLFMWDDSYYESYRFNGKEYQLSGQLRQGVTLSGQAVLNDFSFDRALIWHPL